MAKIRIKGDTSGYIDIAAPAVAGSVTLNLPTSDATFMTTAGGTFTSGIDVTGTVTGENLLIGTGTVTHRLTINGDNTNDDLVAIKRANVNHLIVERATGNETILRMYEADTETIRIRTDGSSYINNGRNFGFGTDNPSLATFNVSATGVQLAQTIPAIGLKDTDTNAECFVGLSGQQMFISNYGTDAIRFINDGSEAMRIDSSGNLLVGTTTNLTSAQISAGVTGFALRGDSDQLVVSRDGGSTTVLNRNTSDGAILEFRKDGSEVGSISVDYGSRLKIGTGDTGLFFNQISDAIQPISMASSSGLRDNAIDLGTSAQRFKDLYLSGGVYLGGTGSANKLEDYEEGTWTPTFKATTTDPTHTVGNASGTYTKTGNLVTVFWDMDATITNNGSGQAMIGGLPFLPATSQSLGGYSAASFRDSNAITTDQSLPLTGWARNPDSTIRIELGNGGSSAAAWREVNGRCTGVLVYRTNS